MKRRNDMCIPISIIAFIYGYISFQDGAIYTGMFSIMTGLFFSTLMIRNILDTRKKRKK